LSTAVAYHETRDRHVETSAPLTERVHALSFPDGLVAAAFLSELRDACDAAPATGEGRAMAWIDSPMFRMGQEVCCVYVTDAALAIARRASLPMGEPDAVTDPRFPAGRILILEQR